MIIFRVNKSRKKSKSSLEPTLSERINSAVLLDIISLPHRLDPILIVAQLIERVVSNVLPQLTDFSPASDRPSPEVFCNLVCCVEWGVSASRAESASVNGDWITHELFAAGRAHKFRCRTSRVIQRRVAGCFSVVLCFHSHRLFAPWMRSALARRIWISRSSPLMCRLW